MNTRTSGVESDQHCGGEWWGFVVEPEIAPRKCTYVYIFLSSFRWLCCMTNKRLDLRTEEKVRLHWAIPCEDRGWPLLQPCREPVDSVDLYLALFD